MLQHHVQPFLDQRLGQRVDAGGGFVQDEDRRVLQQHRAQRDELPLAHRQAAAALADLRVQAVGQHLDPIPLPDQMRHALDLVVAGVAGCRSGCCRATVPSNRNGVCVTMPSLAW